MFLFSRLTLLAKKAHSTPDRQPRTHSSTEAHLSNFPICGMACCGGVVKKGTGVIVLVAGANRHKKER